MKNTLTKISTILILLFVTVAPASAQFDDGVSLYEKGEFKKAAKKLRKVVETDSSNASAWNYLGLSLEKMADFDGAQTALEKAIGIDSAISSFYSNLAFVQLRMKNYSGAKQNAAAAIELDEKSHVAFFVRGNVFLEENNLEGALADSRQAIHFYEKFTAAYVLESEVLFKSFGEKWADDSSEKTLLILGESITSLEKCLQVCDVTAPARQKLEDNRAFYDYLKAKINGADDNSAVNDDPDNVLDVSSKAATDPESAKKGEVIGKVRLAVMFRGDGTIGPIVVLEGLSDEIIQQAVVVARKKMKFKPEVQNGKPVTVIKTVVYVFSESQSGSLKRRKERF